MALATTILGVIEIINASVGAIEAANKALVAAQTGNEDEANRLLAEARAQFDKAVSDWDAAGET